MSASLVTSEKPQESYFAALGYLESTLEDGELEAFAPNESDIFTFSAITNNLEHQPDLQICRLLLLLIRQHFFDALLESASIRSLSRFVLTYFQHLPMASNLAFNYLMEFPGKFDAARYLCLEVFSDEPEKHADICQRIREYPGIADALSTYLQIYTEAARNHAHIKQIYDSAPLVGESARLRSLAAYITPEGISVFYQSNPEQRSTALSQLHLLKGLELARQHSDHIITLRFIQAMSQFLLTPRNERELQCALRCIDRVFSEPHHWYQRRSKLTALNELQLIAEPSLRVARLQFNTEEESNLQLALTMKVSDKQLSLLNPHTPSYQQWKALLMTQSMAEIQDNFPVTQLLRNASSRQKPKTKNCLPFRCACSSKQRVRVSPVESTL